ncbi:hypothetical protein NLU13_4214 [Sarocladium strictum]|uniref:Required for respiratory growth protein 9, mitochondrial n=1 Tax=Sarocladium strictum TaxID=5046 RepID=A0AA39GIG0_SARSR|nr:hypothetical protein NLU13_4214 [Sarocladium strictum]
MACSCRTAPLRSFLSGLAQVHRLDSPSQPLLRRWSRAPLPRIRYAEATALRQLRSFHVTTRAAQESTVAASDSHDKASSSPRESTTSDSALSEGVVESTSVQEPKKKKQRWRRMDESEVAKLKEEQAKGKKQGAKNRKKKEMKKAKNPKKKAAAGDRTDTITEKKGVQMIRRKDGITISTRSTDKAKKTKSSAEAPESSPLTEKLASLPEGEAGQKPTQEKLPSWRIQKEALKEKFPEGWRPRKRLSPDALAGIRALNAQYPDIYTTAALSAKFEVDPEAIRRILKSKWKPSEEEQEKRLERWQKRGSAIWETKAALGIKPPKQWRQEGITRDPSWHAWRRKMVEREKEWEDEEKRAYREQRAASLQSRVAGKVL